MPIQINMTDFNRIKGKLDRLKSVVSDIRSSDNPVNQFRYSILLKYHNAVIRAMNSVDAVDYGDGPNLHYSGRAQIDLQDLGSKGVTWKNLSPATIEEKKVMEWSLKIWKATGDTEKNTRIHKETGFVGIDGSDKLALDHALRTEYGLITLEGNKTPPRALFTIANDVVMAQRVFIADRIKEIILTYVSWGK